MKRGSEVSLFSLGYSTDTWVIPDINEINHPNLLFIYVSRVMLEMRKWVISRKLILKMQHD